MRRVTGPRTVALLGGMLVLSTAAAAGADEVDAGGSLAVPAIAIPQRPPPPSSASVDQPDTDLPRETPIENSLGRTRSTGSAVGGYGELTLNAPTNGPSVVDLRRVVLFVGHDFTDQIRFYSEWEVEHAVSTLDTVGEVEIEQAYLDWLPNRHFGLRGGVILMPAGIINIYHEPPSFFGVDRPDVDTYVIPSTWREPGVGIFGEIVEGLRYQVYLVDGLNANNFSASFGVREGAQEASLAYAGDFAAIARLDYEPVLGTVFGLTAYGGTSGNTLTASVGKVPVGLFDFDARSRIGGLTLRLEVAVSTIGDTAALDAALTAGGPVASLSWGGYAEAGYDLLRWWAPSTSQEFSVFDRFDTVDTQLQVPVGFTADLANRRVSDIVGIVYKPIPQIALKLDGRRQWLGNGVVYNQLDSAITWLF
jgi:hypothetical protein